jgi:hypothetical protein
MLSEAVLLLPLIHFGLIMIGYSRLQRLLEILAPLRSGNRLISEAEIIERGQEISHIVSIASQRGSYKATCLRLSLLVWWFLRLENICSEIRFGVRMIDRKLEAHAWVEYCGVIINDSPIVCEQYRVLQNVLPTTKLGL